MDRIIANQATLNYYFLSFSAVTPNENEITHSGGRAYNSDEYVCLH